jgi:hypothetical protein
MNALVKRIKVPTFSRSALEIADLCARDIWRGVSYKDGIPIESDESFLKLFASPFLNYIYLDKIGENHITNNSIDTLIKVAGLKIMKLSTATTDIQQGLDTLYFGVSRLVKTWIEENNKIEKIDKETGVIFSRNQDKVTSLEIGIQATSALGEGFFTIGGNKKRGSFVALSSRLLFFALPQIKIYNYSTDVAEKLGFNTTNPSLIIKDYAYTLDDGFSNNWQYLREFEMPLSNNVINERLWTLAYDSGWWQRRVYDLALVLHLTGVSPREFLKGLTLTVPKENP